MLRARFTDAQGRRLWRMAPYLAPILLMLFSIFGPIDGPPAAGIAAASLAVFNLLGAIGLRQRTPRNAVVELGSKIEI